MPGGKIIGTFQTIGYRTIVEQAKDETGTLVGMECLHMKKLLLLTLALCLVLAGCKTEQPEEVALSSLAFVNVRWVRVTENCTETIYFQDNGNCGYYCGCGDPVNNDDLCEGYRYDAETQTIYLLFPEEYENTVTKIHVESCDENTLVLDFAGDIRTFERDGASAPTDTLQYEGETYKYLQFPGNIFYYGLWGSVECEEDETVPVPHDRWKLVYREGDLFVAQSQWDAAVADYGNDENYTWSVLIYDPETDEPYTVPITVKSEDLAFLYGMEDMKKDTTLFFDDIQLFGSLVKLHEDGLISARVTLAYAEGTWYWRSETIDDSVEGWPEYVVKLPDNMTRQIIVPQDFLEAIG